MENIKKSSILQEFEGIVPSSGWIEDSTSHILLIELPDFELRDVKVQVVNGKILAKGERQVIQIKHISFEETFKLPENSNVEEISGKFEDGTFYVIVPKQMKDGKEDDYVDIDARYDDRQQTGLLLGSVTEKINKNQGTIIVTALLAFSLGVWVSRKLHYRGT